MNVESSMRYLRTDKTEEVFIDLEVQFVTGIDFRLSLCEKVNFDTRYIF